MQIVELLFFYLFKHKSTMDANFKLIDGEFSVEEAREVITNLLEFKIQYHSKQSFSSEIRRGLKDEPSLERKENLIVTKQEFLKYLENFADVDRITIYSEIQAKK
jgi:hypothetical protein